MQRTRGIHLLGDSCGRSIRAQTPRFSAEMITFHGNRQLRKHLRMLSYETLNRRTDRFYPQTFRGRGRSIALSSRSRRHDSTKSNKKRQKNTILPGAVAPEIQTRHQAAERGRDGQVPRPLVPRSPFVSRLIRATDSPRPSSSPGLPTEA
ncbi:hypothetical protein BT93_H3194 [Corymbia citriodora subsp. variegata]|nr:hypothetical protein BT93_H3194 [Corymbia citriodora subsp. variegata]